MSKLRNERILGNIISASNLISFNLQLQIHINCGFFFAFSINPYVIYITLILII